MDETAAVESHLKALLDVMVTRAEKEVDAILPGYTHLQVGQEPHLSLFFLDMECSV